MSVIGNFLPARNRKPLPAPPAEPLIHINYRAAAKGYI
jgi:hypothetical protein